MKHRRICLLGGTGFVGSRLCARLTLDEHTLIIPTRSIDAAKSVRVLPSTQIVVADVHDPKTLDRLFTDCDAVINLIGILNEHGHDGSGFHRAHVELAEKIVAACKASGVTRLLQMSGLKANAKQGPSHYLRSKGQAEEIIRAAGDWLEWSIFQPSVIFGPEDSFVNRFAGLMKLSPVLPLARPNARFAPVYVEDVAEAFCRALSDDATVGKSFQLCGPKVYSLRELIAYIRLTLGRPGITIGLPDSLSRVQARLLEYVPGKPFSVDNYQSLTVHSICEQNGFEHFGIKPRSLESIVPTYLGDVSRPRRYSAFRREAGRKP